ncbi:hypothetical protein G9A89_021289 [Geosiphon pyriformis]|nr:hypothetical protein G9A89_021289 [Geosiphon pyriformis]
MARRHIGGPRKHRFTNDIIILGVKATNKHNTYGTCKACDEALGQEEALKNLLESQEVVDAYCNKTDNETDTSQSSKKRRNTSISDDDIHTSDVISNVSSTMLTSSQSSRRTRSNSINASDIGAKLLAIVSDSAPAYAAARRRLRLQYPKFVFLPCFAHQCNLAVGDIFKESNEFKTASKQTITINLATTHELPLGLTTGNEESTLNKLQSDTARLYEVLQAFEQWEQPLLLLTFLLNPNIRDTWFRTNTENLNFTYLAQFITYYYKAWFECRPICILLELEEYRKRNYPFDLTTYEQFEENILGFWEFASSSTRELGPLAIRLFGICNEKVLAISQIHASINFFQRKKRISTNNTLMDNEQDELQDIEPSSIIMPDDWENQLRDWEQMWIY